MDFLTSLLDNIEEAIVVTNDTGEILFFNSVTKEISQLSGIHIELGKKMNDILNDDRKKVVDEIFCKIRENHQPEKSFAEYTTLHGGTLYLEFKYIPIVNGENTLTHVFTIFRDISTQKLFEKRISTQANNISNLMDKANAVIIGLDSRGYITDWNQYCHQVTGFTKSDAFAKKFSDLLLPANKELFEELMTNVLLHETVTNYELVVTTKKGTQRQFLLNSSIRRSETGNVIGVTFVGQDATELLNYRRSLEQQVEERTHELQLALAKEKEVVDMKSRFVSVASHEFRTPLSSIEFATTFIKNNKDKIGAQEFYAKLETIEKQIKHMTHLLDDVLTYGKAEAGKIKLHVSPIKLEEFITKVIEDVGHATKNTHEIRLELNVSNKLIVTDEKLLRNIIINLLTNAVKFSPLRKYVYLTIDQLENQLLFNVRDEGIGIPQAELTMVFEPFERGKSVTSIHGTGLGLSIVKKAVELLNGNIHLESTVGEGSKFTVTIPLKDEN